MVKPTLEKNNNDRTNPIEDTPMGMYDEDATEMAGKNREENVQEEHEFLVKWQMPKEFTTTAAKKQLTQLLAVLMISFPDVTFIDHKQREWSFMAKDEEDRFCKELEAALHITITGLLSQSAISFFFGRRTWFPIKQQQQL